MEAIAQRSADTSMITAVDEYQDGGQISLAAELASAENTDLQGFRCLTKAMELPGVAVLTNSVTATTHLISQTRPVLMVTEQIKTVGEREDVQSVLTSVNGLYEDNLSSRVESVKQSVSPSLKTLDDYACQGVDKVATKVSETKDYYVTPAVTAVTDLKDSTVEMYGSCVEKVTASKEFYVDPVVGKVYDMKDSTTKAYSDCTGMISSAKASYVTPVLDKVAEVNTDYVCPTLKRAEEVRHSYVVPALNKAYEAVDNPSLAYKECIEYGKGALTLTKDATISTAIATIDSAKGYLTSAKDDAVNKLKSYIEDAKTNVRKNSGKTLDYTLSYARQTSARVLVKSTNLLQDAQELLYARLVERFPNSVDILDRGIRTVSYASKVLYEKTAETAEALINSTRLVRDEVGKRYEQTVSIYNTSRSVILSATETSLEYGRTFTKANEENIRYVASVAGFSAYLGLIGLELQKEKSL